MRSICDIPDQQLLKRFAEEHFLKVIYTQQKFKHVLAYYVPRGLREFFLDPVRSRCFYPNSWIIDRCQWAMKAAASQLESNVHFHSNFLINFFRPQAAVVISPASRLLEHVRNGSDNNDLLLFLRYLSEIHWLDFCTRSWGGRRVAIGIVHWVCTTLVG
jgi:hypothetical protein